jgi:hypothetical protein
MAAPALTVADLQALIQTLQAQVATLQAAIPAAPAAGAAAVVTFADMPQMFNANDLLNYLTNRGDQASISKDTRHLVTKLLLMVLG